MINYKDLPFQSDHSNIFIEIIVHLIIIGLSLLIAIIGIQRFGGDHLIDSNSQGHIALPQDVSKRHYSQGLVTDWVGGVFGANFQFNHATFERGIKVTSNTYFIGQGKDDFLSFVYSSPFVKSLNTPGFVSFELSSVPLLVDQVTYNGVPAWQYRVDGIWSYSPHVRKSRERHYEIPTSLSVIVQRTNRSHDRLYIAISHFEPIYD